MSGASDYSSEKPRAAPSPGRKYQRGPRAPLDRGKKPVPEISPVIPRRALNIRVWTRIPLKTAADSSSPKKRRHGRRGGKRHKAAEDGGKGKDSGDKTGHKGAAAKRHRTARPEKATGPSQQPFIQAPAPCSYSAHPGYPPLPGYSCCHRPVAPCQAPLVCHRQSAAQNPWDLLTRYLIILCPPFKDAIEEAEDKDGRLGSTLNAFIRTFNYSSEAELAANIASFSLHKLSPKWLKEDVVAGTRSDFVCSHFPTLSKSLNDMIYACHILSEKKVLFGIPAQDIQFRGCCEWPSLGEVTFKEPVFSNPTDPKRKKSPRGNSALAIPSISEKPDSGITADSSKPKRGGAEGRSTTTLTIGLTDGTPRSARPKGSQRPDEGSKAKAAVER
ncbi:hypothetical protein HZS_1046, partial [Henneguya salminicola]